MISNSRLRKAAPALTTTQAPLSVQLYGILISNGFTVNEAAELATKTATAYKSSTQSVFSFIGGLKIEIIAANARVIVPAPKYFETPRRTIERIRAQQEDDLDKRAHEIGERRKRDEWRDQY